MDKHKQRAASGWKIRSFCFSYICVSHFLLLFSLQRQGGIEGKRDVFSFITRCQSRPNGKALTINKKNFSLLSLFSRFNFGQQVESKIT